MQNNNNPRNKIGSLTEIVLAQKCEIENLIAENQQLKDKLQHNQPMRKLSSCCSAILIPFISGGSDSTNTKGAYKKCYECGDEYSWHLDHNQKPLFKRDND